MCPGHPGTHLPGWTLQDWQLIVFVSSGITEIQENNQSITLKDLDSLTPSLDDMQSIFCPALRGQNPSMNLAPGKAPTVLPLGVPSSLTLLGPTLASEADLALGLDMMGTSHWWQEPRAMRRKPQVENVPLNKTAGSSV